jgi:hypothetical protein
VSDATTAVVIPAYNAGRYLDEAIASVRGQSTADWECVVVDDGSTDDTPLRLAALRDPRIRCVRQDNLGELGARAHGFRLTRAPRIVFLDADDRLRPDAVARYAKFLDDHPDAGVAYGERVLIDRKGRAFGMLDGALLNRHPEGDVLDVVLRRPFLSTISQACFRREAVPSAAWSSGRSLSGDWVLLAWSALGSRFGFMGKPALVEYRIRRGSLLRSVADAPTGAAEIAEFDELLGRLFSLPGIRERFSPEKITELRRQAEASCFAIKGQELLRRRQLAAARRYFGTALRAGSRDLRDLLCWLATCSPALARWGIPLYGSIESAE